MIRVRAIHSFASNGLSFYPGLETEVEDNLAKDWESAGLIKIVSEEKKIEEPKELTAEQIERQNLEAVAKQLGIVDGFDTLNNEELENNIHLVLTKKREEREAKLLEAKEQGNQIPTSKNLEEPIEENIGEGPNNETPTDEDFKEKNPKPKKPRQVTDAGEKVE